MTSEIALVLASKLRLGHFSKLKASKQNDILMATFTSSRQSMVDNER